MASSYPTECTDEAKLAFQLQEIPCIRLTHQAVEQVPRVSAVLYARSVQCAALLCLLSSFFSKRFPHHLFGTAVDVRERQKKREKREEKIFAGGFSAGEFLRGTTVVPLCVVSAPLLYNIAVVRT